MRDFATTKHKQKQNATLNKEPIEKNRNRMQQLGKR
jgi:hypothetical protein